MLRPAASFLLAACAAVPLLAQSPHHLVGVTRNGNVRHATPTTCQVLAQCSPAGFPGSAALPPSAGGTAWDPIHQGAWISNGLTVACVDDNCNYLCPPFVVAGLGAGVVITGLEVVTSLGQLWALDSADTLHVLDLACPPTPIATCPVGFVLPYENTGLAVDDVSGLVFYGRYDPVTGLNLVAMADLSAPCAPLSNQILFQCSQPLNGSRGLAVDAVQQRLYVTDGVRTHMFPYGRTPTGATFGFPFCCTLAAAAADPLIGLALRPGQATFTGSTCSSGSCLPCPMQQGLNSDPVLGNVGFGVRLQGAQAGSLVWCAIGDGPCGPIGLTVPPLCGPMHTLPLLGLLGPGVVGGAGCAGVVDVPLPLPMNPALGGLVYSSQFFVLCLNNPLGSALSQCLSFEVQGL